MKNLRIRYIDHKYKDNHKISIQAYTSESTGAKYRVILNLTDMEYYIRNERTKEYIKKSTGNFTNMNVLKRNARNALGKLGVPLSREVRNRTFGVCSKNWSQEKEMQKLREEKKDI